MRRSSDVSLTVSLESLCLLCVVVSHDAVSGTAKQAVTYDYAQRLSTGYDVAASFLTEAVGNLTTPQGSIRPAFVVCPLLNISLCDIAQTNKQLVVLLYNPSMHPLSQRICVPVAGGINFVVADPAGQVVPSQVQPTMPNIARGPASAKYEVQFIATLPPLGFTTYFLTQSSKASATSSPLAIAFHKAASLTPLARLPRLSQEAHPAAAAVATNISNNYWTLTFDASTGFLSTATELSSGDVIPINQQFLYYNAYQGKGQKSGAYVGSKAPLQPATFTPLIYAAQQCQLTLSIFHNLPICCTFACTC